MRRLALALAATVAIIAAATIGWTKVAPAADPSGSSTIGYLWSQGPDLAVPSGPWTSVRWNPPLTQNPPARPDANGTWTFAATGLYQLTVEVSFASGPGNGARRVRIVQVAGSDGLVVAESDVAAIPGEQDVQVAVQPGVFTSGSHIAVQVQQDSGAPVALHHVGLQSPSFMLAYLGPAH